MGNKKYRNNLSPSFFSLIKLIGLVLVLTTTISSIHWVQNSRQYRGEMPQIPTALATGIGNVTPTLYCLSGNPCTTPDPTYAPTSMPISTETTSPSPPVPTNNPCITNDASVQTYQAQKKHKKTYKSNNGNHYGWFSQFIQSLISFLEELLRQLGLRQPSTTPSPTLPENNGNNDNNNNLPTTSPDNATIPTIDPCVSYTPAAPTQVPLQPTNSQTNPTTVPQPPTGAVAQGFLTANGKTLMLDGKVYKYVGVNAFQIAGTVEWGADYSKEELDAFFAALPPRSLTRAWAWNDSNMDQMRRAVQSAEEHNQLLILTLSEGAGWDKVGQRPDEWYREGYKSYLLPWIDIIVGEFKNSKAIGMWEIMNEPAGDQQNPSYESVKGFMSTVAARIKQNDPNHLVGTGAIRCSVPGFGDNCADINNDPNIDVMSSHDYTGDATVTGTYYEDKQQLDSINKPWIIGEAGIKGGDYGGGNNCPRSGAERAEMFKQKIDAYFQDGRVSGINLWIYTKNATCGSDGFDFNLTDPIMNLLRSYPIPS